ncbi:hypothetical protein C2751_06685 [Polynucleobacter paneuropaeus]|uniref:hypothetical protein n=1 Tax=Polynucleobacter paneuropaeus TaxID=2527775 RepID=UPI001BFDCF3C|nr:hypothetical protein [Polynucleobacter paneuropaeus]MBT8635304.1 hypothetical protein [Polynucleobacter paneuropaeus]QWD55242.1 hypothetical protein C2750_05760 [Polynucleobacter paneuropaeus]QWD56890.1 hypothetical protein C2754_05480 [Polynucleobacter paneuropaeus]
MLLLHHKRLPLSFATALTLSFSTAFGQTAAEDAEYQKALSLNRASNYVESAVILKSLMLAHPEIARYKLDYIDVASSAKQCNEVIAKSSDDLIRHAPPYVKEAIFSCYASTRDFAQTENLAKLMIASSGKNEAIELGMVRLAKDNKNLYSSLYWSVKLVRDFPKHQDNMNISKEALEIVGNEYALLMFYEDLYKNDTKDPGLQKQIIQVMLDMGIPNLALDLIDKRYWSYSDDQKIRAMQASGVNYIRWGRADSAVAPNRFLSIDASIKMLNQAFAYAKSINAPLDDIHSIQFDLIVAYNRRKNDDQSLVLYDQLRSEGVEVPDYAMSAVAASYSAKHQFEKANLILSDLYKKDPTDLDLQLDFYYNLIDLDRYSEAKPILEQLTVQLKNRPKYLPKRDFDYTRAVIEAASFESYQEKYQAADQKLKPLLSEIPSNADLLKTVGSVRQAEGMFEAAEDYFSIASKQDPQDVEAKVGYANARMSRGDIQTFNSIVNELKPGYDDMTPVKEAIKRQDIFQEGYVTGNFVLGNGQYLGQTNNNHTSDLRVYSAPIDDNFRAFARYRDLNSGPAISVTDHGVGAGVQYTGLNQEAEVEVGDAGYFRAEGTQTLSDHWSATGSFEKNAFYLMPGALYAISGGNVGGTSVKWKNGETTDATVGYRYWALPNNIRQEVYGNVNQRLLTEYNYKVDMSGWVGNQQNTNSNVNYFSPINQTEYSGTVSLRILQWRDIETKKYDFWHRLYATYGVVTQAGFMTLPMNSYGYGQEFNVGDKRTLSWSIGRTSFPFDGAKSSYTTGFLNFESRF